MKQVWQVKIDERFYRDLKKIDKKVGQEVFTYLQERIATNENPRRFGKPLIHHLHGLWRYRVRDYRIICRIVEDELIVLALRIGHRKNVYNDF